MPYGVLGPLARLGRPSKVQRTELNRHTYRLTHPVEGLIPTSMTANLSTSFSNELLLHGHTATDPYSTHDALNSESEDQLAE
jgi:hypothetical protein